MRKKNCVNCKVAITPLDGDFCCDNCRKKYCNKKIKFVMPWPPSVNKRLAHRRGQGRIYLSHYFKNYYKEAGAAINAQLKFKNKKITEQVDQILTFHPPDKRRRDNDNYTKAVNDAIKYANIVEDDSLFRDCLTRWREPVQNGCVKVILGKIKFNVESIGE